MIKIGTYRGFKLYQITKQDVSTERGYYKGDIIAFLPDDEIPELGYEEWVTETMEEMHDFIDSHDSRGTKQISATTPKSEPERTQSQREYSAVLQEVFEAWDKHSGPDAPPKEKNQGYEISMRINMNDETSFVLAENENAPQPIVVWQCKTDPETGKRDYFWGRYSENHRDSIDHLCQAVLTWKRDFSHLFKEKDSSQQTAIKGGNIQAAVVSGLGNLTREGLAGLNNEFLLFLCKEDTNLNRQPAEMISEFLSTLPVYPASVAPLKGEEKNLSKTDLLFNTRSGQFEHSDAWMVEQLDRLAKQGREFTVSQHGVKLPPETQALFTPEEIGRAEKMVIDAHKTGAEKTLHEPVVAYSRGR